MKNKFFNFIQYIKDRFTLKFLYYIIGKCIDYILVTLWFIFLITVYFSYVIYVFRDGQNIKIYNTDYVPEGKRWYLMDYNFDLQSIFYEVILFFFPAYIGVYVYRIVVIFLCFYVWSALFIVPLDVDKDLPTHRRVIREYIRRIKKVKEKLKKWYISF